MSRIAPKRIREAALDPGAMRAKITIQNAPTKDSYGQPIWATYIQTRAQVQAMEGRELFTPGVTGSETEIVFTMRNRTGVKATMRVLWGQRTFVIKSAVRLDETRPVGMQLFCREVTIQ